MSAKGQAMAISPAEKRTRQRARDEVRARESADRITALKQARVAELDTMPCGCESGSCYCDTIDRDWDAYEAARTPVLDH
jgi:hypothetical protein